jgi:multiple sugar transport system substrate-binding protein
VKTAVAAWSTKSGTPAEVQVASDLNQQTAQGFASGSPADIMYVGDQFAAYAKAGNLYDYSAQMTNKADFYPSLVSAFSYKGQLVCAPKDFSTLGLVINTDMWKAAGLTDADLPTTWDQLEAAAKKLTTGGVVGLSYGPEVARLGAFMAEAGGGLVDASGNAAANSQANIDALTFAKKLETEGVAKNSKDLGAGWGGEAFGKKLAAMVIEGNWISGAMDKDYKGVGWKAVELPAGKAKGTLVFSNCWGVAAKSKNVGGAVDLVNFLTSKDQQLAFGKAFGVIPSIQSAADQFKADNPLLVPFVNGATYAQSLPAQPGVAPVLADLNSKLPGLKTADPKAILDATQTDLDAALKG